jgi:hypothetical protein
MQDIKDWLNGPKDWTTGCDLVFKHHPDKTLHRVFMEAPTPYKIARLHQVLTDLVENATTDAPGAQILAISQKTHREPQAETSPENAKKWAQNGDPVLNALHLQWKPLFLEMNDLMSRLHDTAKAGATDQAQKAEAGRMAHRILDLDDMCDAIYHKRDTYNQTGALPVDHKKNDDMIVDPKRLPLALANAKKYVRDYKAKVKKNPTNEFYAAKLHEYQTKVKLYTKMLE